jgi:hypothetical protein
MSVTELHVLELSLIEGVPALTKGWTRPVKRDMQGSAIEVFMEGAFVGYAQIAEQSILVHLWDMESNAHRSHKIVAPVHVRDRLSIAKPNGLLVDDKQNGSFISSSVLSGCIRLDVLDANAEHRVYHIPSMRKTLHDSESPFLITLEGLNMGEKITTHWRHSICGPLVTHLFDDGGNYKGFKIAFYPDLRVAPAWPPRAQRSVLVDLPYLDLMRPDLVDIQHRDVLAMCEKDDENGRFRDTPALEIINFSGSDLDREPELSSTPELLTSSVQLGPCIRSAALNILITSNVKSCPRLR